jgi:hypothetical protein
LRKAAIALAFLLLLVLPGRLAGPPSAAAEDGFDASLVLQAMDMDLEAAQSAMVPAAQLEARALTLAQSILSVDGEPGFEANLVRVIDISAGGNYTRLLLGDVSGDGRMEIVTMQADYMANDATTGHYVQCLAAFDIATGEMLWRIGTPETRFGSQATDIPAQIYDIDGDGYNEVLAVVNNPSQLRIFDGRTGQLKATRPLPTATARDALMIANFQGKPFPQDIVLKDRYNNLWAYDYETWTLLFKWTGNVGHYPWPYDWTGDGRDWLMAGFDMLNYDGTRLWSVQGLADHADSMWIGDLNDDGEPEIVIGGGTNAVVLYSKEGYEIWRTEGIRESQNVFMGRFRDDLPGMQVAGLDRVNRSSGPEGQDALFLIGYDGQLLWKEDRHARGEYGCWSTIPEPVHNYTGSGLDEILTWFRGCGVLPGIYNGYGERVATIPIDGRMMRGNMCGDEREEVVVYLGGDKVYIYSLDTCSDLDGPPPGVPLPQTQPRVQYNYTRYTAGSTPVTAPTKPRVATPVPPGTNLALRKPKTASTSSTSMSAMYANDGNTATRWEASSTGNNQWWAVDLGAVYELTGSEVMWQYARAYRYKVEVSADSKSWTVVADKTNNTSMDQVQRDSFGAAGRFVRITVTGLPPNTTRASIYEFRVFGNAPTPPVITPIVSGVLGSNGWYVSDVEVTWEVSDPDTPVTGTDGCGRTVIDYDTGEVILTCTATSAGGTSSESVVIKRDATPPVVTIAGAEDAQFCSAPARPTYEASDNLSGLAEEGDSWLTPGTASGAGAYTYSAWAIDAAGNRTEQSAGYTVTYGSAFGGFLPPIRADGSSRFRLGSTIPVKFRLLCGDQPITNAVARLHVSRTSTVPGDGVMEPISTAAATSGNLFRYDPVEGQYIFNLSTKAAYANPSDSSPVPFSEGTWVLSALLDDGTSRSVEVQLVK